VRAGSSSVTTATATTATAATTVETFAFAKAGLAVAPRVTDLIHLCPILDAPASVASTLARVVPYHLATSTCFVAIAGAIDNVADLERRFAARSAQRAARPASASFAAAPTPSPQAPPALLLRGAHSLPLPAAFEAERDAALAEEVACLSLTPPPPGGPASAAAAAAAAASPRFSFASGRDRLAALSGVKRAVDAGEAAASAVLALVDDALGGAGARAADYPAQALTLALAEVQGSFALVVHDEERGFTLAARDAGGEQELWFSFAADGGAVVFASPAPLGGVGGQDWHELPAGHFVVVGGGLGRQPRLHQFALSPEQLSARASAAAAAAAQEHERAPGAARKRDGVALSAAMAGAAADWPSSSAAARAGGGPPPISPRSSSYFDEALYE
jgi:hypothetical protein